MKLAASIACIALLLCSCQTMQAEADVPAIIASPDADSRAALQSTVNGLFAGQDVLIAAEALTTSSILPIEFGPRGSLDNPPATGRLVEQPLRFRLVKNGENCILIDPRDDSRHLLADTTCVPE